ncbi:uncharacterized protein LOC141660851 [Apium graveolens]|uniref:uncharacterized protein LOC141660851 n=1 Tax=Apium graveolens TaxID=4045 RepID=UPI003D79129C
MPKVQQCAETESKPSGSILSLVPFAVWGIDIMGPFPRAKGNLRYMNKLVEAKAMRTINQQDYFEAYLKELGIKHKKTSVAHPQGNRQVEVTNRTVLRGLEKRLEESKKNWPDELLKVLWSYRTTSRTGTRETPFKLAYGTEARLPVETRSPSHRVINFDEVSNIEGLKTNLEL